MTESRLNPPAAPTYPVTRTFHGHSFVDEYEWMRDKESQETLDYLEAENAYTKQETAHLEDLTETIFQEMKSRVKETDMSVPVRVGKYWYYIRTEEGKSYSSMCRKPVKGNDDPWLPPTIEEGVIPEGEEVILDQNALAEGHEFFSMGGQKITRSGRLMLYSVDFTGSERFDLYVKDLDTGELLEDKIEGIFYGGTWAGEEYIFYSRVDDAWRPYQVWRHKLGTPQEQDVLVYEEKDERFNVGIAGGREKKFLYLGSGSKTTSEAWVIDLENPEGEPRLLWEREAGVDYDVDYAEVGGQEYWVVTHNAVGPNFQISYCPIGEEGRSLRELDTLVEHEDDVRIEGVDCCRDYMIAGYRRGGIGRVAVMDLTGGDWGEFKELEFEEEVYSASAVGYPDWDAPVMSVQYTSYTTPLRLLQYRPATGEYTLLREQEVQGGYNAEDYVSSRHWVTAADGSEIPVSLIHRADLDVSVPNGMLLYGYGSYETSMDPYFSYSRLSMLDRGVIYAVAHVRGGGEMGRSWYDQGKLGHKKNTFTDFIAVADDLISQGLTTPQQLVAEGGSAGGLLMGAIANMAPEKFAGILASVPFVDPLTSMLKPELPLTVLEWEEWGDPVHDPQVYEYMRSYAPYENVVAQDYPDILAITSLNDTRVLYVEPAKWVAKLRATATGGSFLLKTEMNAGHGGVSGRYEAWREGAFELAWVINKTTGKVS